MSIKFLSRFSVVKGSSALRIISLLALCCLVSGGFASTCVDAQQSTGPAEGTLEYYKGLAEKGNAEAQLKLADLYRQGKDIAQNISEAAKWYRKAAEQGLQDAQFKLGELYYEGKGIAQDAKEAANWLEKAASQGNKAATEKLQEIKSKAQDSLKDLNKALDMIR